MAMSDFTDTEESLSFRPIAAGWKYLILIGFLLLLFAFGCVFSPSTREVIDGFRVILTHPSTVDFDGLAWGGNFAPAFFNSFLLMAAVLASYRLLGIDLQGEHLAALMMTVGFSFSGKNILNVWFPILGVVLYARLSKKPMKDMIALAWFSTALSPVFSVTAFGTENLPAGSLAALMVGAVLGILGGALTGVLSAYLPGLHKGRFLFNAGLAAGTSAVFINAMQRAFSIGHDRFPYDESNYVAGSNRPLGLAIGVLFLYLFLVGVLLKGLPGLRKLATLRTGGRNFVESYGFGASLVNMGIIGLMTTLYVFLTGNGQFCGPVYAAICTAAGFAAAGVTLRQYLPTMVGVCLMAALTGGIGGIIGSGNFLSAAGAKIASRGMILAVIYSCGAGPIVFQYGWLAGMVVGAIHSVLVGVTASFHGWMSLYNNGFSLGLIVLLLPTIFEMITPKRISSHWEN